MKKGIPILITAVLGAAVCSVIRFFQYVTILDFETGFFTLGSGFAGTLIYAAFAAFGAAAVFFAVFGARRGWAAVTAPSDRFSAKATLVQGVFWLVAAAIQCAGLSGAGAFELIAGVLSAASLAAFGFILLKNSVPPKASGLLNLIPALCLFLNLTNFFRTDIIIKNHSENLILLLGYICGVFFLSGAARFSARLEAKSSRVREIIFASLTLILTLTHTAAKALGFICGGESVSGMAGIDPAAASLSVMSLGWLITVCCFSRRADTELDAEDELEKN